MAKILSLDDLIERKYSEISGDSLKNLYDLVLPIGTPKSIIFDLVEFFDLDIVERTFQNIDSDIVSTTVIVLRGDLETVKKAEIFMKNELKKWIDNLN